jgi:hypothetical protein
MSLFSNKKFYFICLQLLLSALGILSNASTHGTSRLCSDLLSNSYLIGVLVQDAEGSMFFGAAPYFSGSHETIIAEMAGKLEPGARILWGGEVKLAEILKPELDYQIVEINETSGYLYEPDNTALPLPMRYDPMDIVDVTKLLGSTGLISSDVVSQKFSAKNPHLYPGLNEFKAQIDHDISRSSARHAVRNAIQLVLSAIRLSQGDRLSREKFVDMIQQKIFIIELLASLLAIERYPKSLELWQSILLLKGRSSERPNSDDLQKIQDSFQDANSWLNDRFERKKLPEQIMIIEIPH